MNIGLNEAVQGKIKGEIEISAGVEDKHLIEAEAIRVNANKGSTVFLRSNNIGTSVMQPLEYLGLITDYGRLKQSQTGELSILPEPLLIQSDASLENQHLIMSSNDLNFSEKTRGTISLLGLYKQIEKKAILRTDFFDTETDFLGDSQIKQQFYMLSLNINMKHEYSKNVLLELDLPILLNQYGSEDTKSGLLGQQVYEAMFNKENNLRHYSPKLTLSIRHSTKWISTHNLSVDNKNNSFERTFLETSNVSTQPTYTQNTQNPYQNISLLSSVEHRHNIFLLKVWNNIALGAFDTDFITSSLLLFKNEPSNGYYWFNWKPTIQYGIKNANWMTHVELEIAREQFSNSNSQTFKQTWINPLFRLKYNWNLSKFIGISVGQTQKFTEQKYTFDIHLLENNINIVHYALEAGQQSNIKRLDAYYFNINKEKNSSVTVNFNYQDVRNSISQFNRFENNLIISELFLAPRSNSSTLSLSFSHPILNERFSWKTKINTRLSVTERTPYRNINEQQL
ncbi:MAG: hypothetical protein HC908_16680, partial [Calothrix sp. SM1_7_51]|nr:hypothetical protein [Calothrix sp. SM1_7_51]